MTWKLTLHPTLKNHWFLLKVNKGRKNIGIPASSHLCITPSCTLLLVSCLKFYIRCDLFLSCQRSHEPFNSEFSSRGGGMSGCIQFMELEFPSLLCPLGTFVTAMVSPWWSSFLVSAPTLLHLCSFGWFQLLSVLLFYFLNRGVLGKNTAEESMLKITSHYFRIYDLGYRSLELLGFPDYQRGI